ncbi:MAG TPA: site-2 protease family protein [Chthoniobacteraceae bacterium]|nr:site-2 protease family protein [Chthoniobacteraceae bacterium]
MIEEKQDPSQGGGADGQGNPPPEEEKQPTRQRGFLSAGSIHLFRAAGINVSLHFSWFIVAAYELSTTKGTHDSLFTNVGYSSAVWNLIEYLALFAIVLMHEFGHALACRQTGGTAERIVLWPLGGIAFVRPPPRPGAVLWSIAAGPLVNVVLLPVTWGLYLWGEAAGWNTHWPDLFHCVLAIAVMNTSLLVFNMLPIYPLDGGQIVQALLWFAIGRTRSLLVSSVAGIAVGGILGVVAWLHGMWWLAMVLLFIVQQSLQVNSYARNVRKVEKMPRTEGFACPSCREKPVAGDIWVCEACNNRFDMFATGAVCPHCGHAHEKTECPFCRELNPIARWRQ